MAGDDPPNPSPSSLGIRLMSEMWHLTGGMAGCYEESLVLMEDKRLDMERRLDEMRARLLVLEHMNQNVCIRRRNAFLRRLGPEAELRPLVSVVRGGGIEGFPGTMREWERLTGRLLLVVFLGEGAGADLHISGSVHWHSGCHQGSFRSKFRC